MKKIALLILFSFLNSCINKERKTPKIIDGSFDTILINNTSKMNSSRSQVFMVNASHLDTVYTYLNNFSGDTFSDFGLFHNNKSDSLTLIVKPQITIHTPELLIPFFKLPPPPDKYQSQIDSLILENNKKTHLSNMNRLLGQHYEMTPLFIYNPSIYDIEVEKPIAGGDLFIILEAKNSKNDWKPIEFFEQYRFLCGTGHHNYLLKSKKFIVAGFRKYSGNFKTKGRIKLLSKQEIYYSNTFDIEINVKQFDSFKAIDSIYNHLSSRNKNLLTRRMFLN